jgi:hypothetical protein
MKKEQQILLGVTAFIALIGIGTASIILIGRTETTPTGLLSNSSGGYTTEDLTLLTFEIDDLRMFDVTFLSYTDNSMKVALASGKEIEVAISDETQFLRRNFIAPEEFERLNQAYVEESQNMEMTEPAQLPEPPLPYEEVQLDPTQLKSGDIINLQTFENALTTTNLSAQVVTYTDASDDQESAPSPAI